MTTNGAYQGQAVNLQTNQPYPGATVSIYNWGSNTLATIYDAATGTIPLSNPMTADQDGIYAFQAPSSLGYQAVWSSGGYVSPLYGLGPLAGLSSTTASVLFAMDAAETAARTSEDNNLQTQITGLAGGLTLDGTWNASTNSPALASSVGTNGHYYIVAVAGTTVLNGISTWAVGDWAVFEGAWRRIPKQQTPVIDVKSYGAIGNGIADDTTAIRNALNAAAAAGYGQVYAPTGVYYCTGGLLVPSGVHFYGDGPDATIIRNPAGALPGITQSGITVFATIGSIQSVGARVSDLCVDHATNGCTSNGISFVAASGARSADYTIERCKVLGYDSHQYLIWGLRVENAVIRDNIVIGGGAPGSTSQSEGIEIFGGSFVEITGNYVTGMSSDCVNLVEDSGTPDTALSDLNVHHNYLVGAGRGVNLSVISTGLGFIISDNIILNSYLSSNGQAILAGVSSGGTMNGVTISDNEIIGAENIGIYLTATGAASASGWKVSGNSITGMTGAFPIGINADGIGALICDNYIVAGYEGISINNAGTTSSVLGNKIIAGSAGIAVAQDGNSSANVIGNDLVYGGGGIVATAGCTGTAVGNNFQYVGTEVAAVNVPSSYSVRGNNLAYAPTILDPFGAGRNQINCLILPRAAASLPAASSVQMGTKEFVTDANATTFGTAVAGGGTNKVPVWSNQTNWLIG